MSPLFSFVLYTYVTGDRVTALYRILLERDNNVIGVIHRRGGCARVVSPFSGALKGVLSPLSPEGSFEAKCPYLWE